MEHLSNLTEQEAIELGSKIAALVGLGIEGKEGMGDRRGSRRRGVPRPACESSPHEGAWDVLEDIPRTTRPRRCSSSSITGRCRCATRSCARAGSASRTASSARSTSSRSELIGADEAKSLEALQNA